MASLNDFFSVYVICSTCVNIVQTTGPTSAVVSLWWRNTAKQQTAMSSQRQYAERRDLAYPRDSKSKCTHTVYYCMTLGSFKENKSPRTSRITPTPPPSLSVLSAILLLHLSLALNPLSSWHRVVYPHSPSIPSTRPSFKPFFLSLWTDRKLWRNFKEARDDALVNVCSPDKNRQNKPPRPLPPEH